MNKQTEQVLPRKIFWLASYPKSGNTWVRMFLDVYVTGFPVKYNSAYRYVNIDLDVAALQLVSAKPLPDLTLMDHFLYRPAMLNNLLHQAKTKDVVIKTHNANVNVTNQSLIPTAITGGAIYIVRDPRDIVLSYASHLGLPVAEVVTVMNNTEHIAHRDNLCHIVSSWSLHVQTWIRSKEFPVTIVKYENLLANPKDIFVQILRALGIINIDWVAFDFALEQTTFANLAKMENEQGFIERSELSKDKFFRVGKAGQWEPGPIADQIEIDHAAVMNEMGYIG